MLGLQRPPRWGVVGLVLFAVLDIGLIAWLALRPAPADPFAGSPAPSTVPAAAEGSPPEVAPTGPDVPPTEPAAPLVLAVYGDGYSAGSSLGGRGAAGWPALVAASLGADLRLNAASMTGYAAVGSGGQDFAGLARANPVPDATVTIVFGSRNDEDADPATVAQNAAAAFASILEASPETELLVIGPAWSDADPPVALTDIREAVRESAEAAGATFVDPLTDEWFATPDGLIATDGISPLDAGHEYLAGLITPAVQSLTPTG